MNTYSKISKATLDAIVNVDSKLNENAIEDIIANATSFATWGVTFNRTGAVIDAETRDITRNATYNGFWNTTRDAAPKDAIREILERINS